MIWMGCLLAVAAMGEPDVEFVQRVVPIYGDEAASPWDELYQTFYIRRFTTGETYYHRLSFTPPSFQFIGLTDNDTTYSQVVERLDRVSRLPDSAMEEVDPKRRLLFFRDLWTVSDQLQNPRDGVPEKITQRRQEIVRRIGLIMRRLELSEAEVASLPNTLKQIQAAGLFPATFDPADPGQPFASPDLLDEDTKWVTIKTGKRVANGAPNHQQSVGDRSLFSIHIRLPAGTAAVEELIAASHKKSDLFDFPPGTILVLLRRAIAPLRDGRLKTTNVVESLQTIIIPEKTERMTSFAKLILDRRDFVQGKPGLIALTSKTPVDAFSFESAGQWSMRIKNDADTEPLVLGQYKGHGGIPSLNHCFMCHANSRGALFANFSPFRSYLSNNAELISQVEEAKANSEKWQKYLQLRQDPSR